MVLVSRMTDLIELLHSLCRSVYFGGGGGTAFNSPEKGQCLEILIFFFMLSKTLRTSRNDFAKSFDFAQKFLNFTCPRSH